MEFSTRDIIALYGDTFLRIKQAAQHQTPATEKPVAEAIPQPEPSVKTTAPTAEPEKPTAPTIIHQEPEPRVVPPPAPPVRNPETVAPEFVAEMPKQPTMTGQPIAWKLRPTSRFALVLTEEEFGRKLLTSALKTFVESAKIPLEYVGFGVLPNADAWDLGNMPVSTAIFFSEKPAHLLHAEGKTLHFVAKMTEIVQQPALEKTLEQLMTGLT